ncbi:hypothetical protein [Arthrobacter zhaoguopingii]|uniref:hypothetical protein n=1 Tax=Arthrobacter zhaoguopingii TaxID=2681491 RepID=UPI00135C4102|nr:hypothetical protein [Arthrobacter zhaoguopingii]
MVHPPAPPPVRDSLTIFVDGEEVPGLIVYGLAAPSLDAVSGFPSEAWIASPSPEHFVLHGEGWKVFLWEVPIIIWPTGAAFQTAVRQTLQAMIDNGCRVAWIGAEGVPFCNPPALFDPECMSDGVLAWMTDTGHFDCPLDPDKPISPVAAEILCQLRTHAEGLADAI